jgi:hypothetical protein
MIEKYNYKPSKRIHERIIEINKNNQLINSGILNCWSNKFEYDTYDLEKNFELYLKTE